MGTGHPSPATNIKGETMSTRTVYTCDRCNAEGLPFSNHRGAPGEDKVRPFDFPLRWIRIRVWQTDCSSSSPIDICDSCAPELLRILATRDTRRPFAADEAGNTHSE